MGLLQQYRAHASHHRTAGFDCRARQRGNETHSAYAGLYWGPVSWPGAAAVVESADADLFAGALLSDYATTGFTAAIDPKKLLLAMPGEVRLPGATYAGVELADSLERWRARSGATTPRSWSSPAAALAPRETRFAAHSASPLVPFQPYQKTWKRLRVRSLGQVPTRQPKSSRAASPRRRSTCAACAMYAINSSLIL